MQSLDNYIIMTSVSRFSSMSSRLKNPRSLSVSWSKLWSLAAATVLLPTAAGVAEPVKWTAGSSADFNWSNATNWDFGIPTLTSEAIFPKDLLNFAPTGYPNPAALPNPGTITLNAGSVANSLSFFNKYTLTGGDLTLASGLIQVSLGNSSTIASKLSGSNGLTKDNAGSLVLSNAANDYTGATTINGGALIITDGHALGSSTSTVTVTGNTTRGSGGGLLVIGSANNNTAGLTFTRDLAVTGGGPTGDSTALNSVGNNRFTGSLVLGGNPAGLSPVSGVPITVSGTRLASTFGTATLDGPVTVGPSGQTVQFGGNGNWQINGAVSGAAIFEKAGNGLMVLSGDNSGLSGIVQTSGGFLRVSDVGALGTSTATNAINLNAGVLEVRSDTPNFAAKKVTLANNTALFADRAIGGAGLNQTATFGTFGILATTSSRTFTLNARNGYGMSFTGDMVAGSYGPTTITNNANGLVSFVGNFWNTTSTTARALVFAGNGDTLVAGSVLASGQTHSLTKQGTGTLTLNGTGSTFTGSTTIEGGTVAINDFRALNNAAAGNIHLGSTTTTAGTLSIIGNNLTQANLTTAKVINLRGTTASGTILANQTGTSPGVIFTSDFTATGAGSKTLSLGGTNTADNEVRGAIVDNSPTNTTTVRKTGLGTWMLSGANTYTGATQVSAGLLKIQDTFGAASRNVIADTSSISFVADTATQNAGGTLQYVGAPGAASLEAVGALIPAAGASTIKVTPGANGTATLNIASIGTRTAGATVDFAPAAGGSIVLGTAPAGYVGAFSSFQGANFAYAPSTTSATLRAPIYGTDAGFVEAGATLTAGSHNSVLGGTTTSGAMTISSLRMNADAVVTQTGLLTINTGANTPGGILASGGTFGGITGTGVTTGGSGDLVVRVNGSSDVFTLVAPVTSTTTGGLTKTGAGTLIISGTNAQTGATSINEGTVQLSGSGRLSGTAALNLRQGATFDLNGRDSSTVITSFNGAGTVTNSSAGPATLQVGSSGGTGVFTGLIQDGNGRVSVVKNSTGAQTWSGLNTYTGSTNIPSTGILSIPNLADIGAASGLGRGDATSNATNAASLVLSSASATQGFGGISYTGADSISINRLFTFGGTAATSGARLQANGANNATLIFNNTAPLAFSVGNTAAQGLVLGGASLGDNQFNPQITDNPNAAAGAAPTSLYKSDAGLWILGNAANSYTGLTQINAGALRADGTALPANSPLVLNGGVLQTSGTFTRALAATPVNGVGSVGWLSGAGGGFAASTAKLTVNIGGNATPDVLTWGSGGFVGGTLQLSSTTSLAEVDFINPIDLNGAARTVNVDFNPNTNSDLATLSGVISGGTGSGLTKTGTGILRLLGNNTYTGDTLINGGTVRAVSLGNSTSTSSNFGVGGKISISTGSTSGTLAYVGSGETSNRLIEVAGTTSTVVLESSGTGPLILSNVVNASTGTGAKTLALRGDLNAANEISSVLANNSAGGVLAVTKDDNGTWILSGANTFSGTATVSAGALGLGSDSVGPVGALTSGPVGIGGLTISNGSIFAFNGDRTISNAVTFAGNASSNFIGNNSITLNGSLVTTTGGNTTVTNSLAAGKVLTINSPTYTGQETTSTSIRTLVFNGSGDTVLNSSVTDSTAATPVVINLNYQGYGSLTLGGQSTYSGSTTIQSGLVKLGVDNALPSGAGKGNVTINPGAGLSATFDLNGHTQTINGLTANTAGTIRIDNSAAAPAALTFGANDAAVNLIGGITNTGTGALSITKTGTGIANLSGGPFSYRGVTAVTGGTLNIPENVSGTTGLSVTGTGSALNLTGGLSAAPNIKSVNVGTGSLLNFFDSTGTPISNLTSLTLGAGAILNLNTGATSDTLTLLTGSTANVGGQVTLNIRDTGSMTSNATYDLLVAADGGLTTGGTSTGSYVLSQIPGGFAGLTLNQTDTRVSLSTGQLVISSIYWSGAAGDGKWGTFDSNFKGLNFSKDKAGTIVSDFLPGAGTTVVFQADSLTGGGAVSTTLEQGFRINALEFEASTNPVNTPASVSIAPGVGAGNRLTIEPSSPAEGITLKAGGPTAVTISAPVGLGSNQTWTVASAGSTLTVSGPLSGSGTLAKAGAGKVIISSAADGTFAGQAVTVNGGALELTNAGALGSALLTNLSAVTVNNGGTFYYNNATSGTVANAITLNGGTLAAAAASQTYSGPITLASDSTVSTRDAGVTVGTTRTVTLSGVVSGPGKMIVNGNTALSGGTTNSGAVALTQANPNWTGGLLLQQGTMDVRQEQSLGTGAVAVNMGRFLFRPTSATDLTWNQFAAGLTVDNPGANAIVELQADNLSTGRFVANVTGQVNLGSTTSPGFLRLYHADATSSMTISGPIVLGNHANIHTSGGALNTQTAVISGVISEQGGSYSVKFNGDTVWGSNNYQNIRLDGANTFTGGLTLSANTLDFSTVSNDGGPASNLGMGTDGLTIAGGTLRFVGGVSQSTNRAIVYTSGGLAANGVNGATITYAGGIDAATTASSVTLTGTGAGLITGGLTQSGTSVDLLVNSGNWTIKDTPVTLADDVIVTGGTLNLGTTGVLAYTAGTSNGLYVRSGGTINLLANDVNGVANSGGLDFLMVGDSTSGATATVNTNGFNLTTPRLDLGGVATGLEGVITGNGTLTFTSTVTDYSAGIRTFRGLIDANLAGVSAFLKQGFGEVILAGDNSGLTGTVAATRLDSGTLTLDYSTNNASKLSSVAALDLRGVTLNVNGGILADTTQTVGGLTINNGSGANRITLTSGAFATKLNLGALTRGSQLSTLRIDLPALGGVTTTTANGAGASLGGWLTITSPTGTNFAMNDGAGNIVPVISSVKNDVATWAAADHVTNTGTGFTNTVNAATISSLRFDAAGGSTVNIAPTTGVLSIANGGVLVTSNVAGATSINGGTLTSGTAELIFTTDNAAPLTVSSGIRINNAVTKTGTGTLLLTGTNTYTGATNLAEGTLVLSGGNAVGDTSAVTLADDRPTTLQLLASETIGRLQGGNSATGSVAGVIDLGANNLTINATGANTTYAGVFTGSGTLTKLGAGTNTNLNLTGLSSGFTGPVVINGGLFQLSGIGALNASSVTVNKNGTLMLDNNGTTRSGTRLLDTTPIFLNSADGSSSGSTVVRGVWIRTDQAATTNETVGTLNFASGANYFAGEASGTTGVAALIASDFVRTNNATLDARGRALGATSGDRNQLRIGVTAAENAFISTLVGGTGTTATNKSIVPWAIGETTAGSLADTNMGNTFVTYIAGRGIVPLDLATEYAPYATAAATDNVREILTADLPGLAGKTVNALALHNNNTAASAIAVTGTGAGQALDVTSGAMLFTLNTAAAASSAHSITLGGFNAGITAGSTNEYVIHVVNPSGIPTTATLTATIASPLVSTADITKSGRGTLLLTGTNTAGGGSRKTTLNEGVLEIADLDNIGGNTGGLVFAGGTLRLGPTYGGDDLSTRTITFLSGGGTLDTNGFGLILANSLGSGVGGFTKIGAGTLTLNAAATYTGPTVIQTGSVIAGANNALGTGDLTIADAVTLDLGANTLNHGAVTLLGTTGTINGTGTLSSTGFTLQGGTVNAVLGGTGGLVKTGTGALTLGGLNTFAGGVDIQGGAITFNTISSAGFGPSAFGEPATDAAGIIHLGSTTTGVTFNYTGAGSISDRRLSLQSTTGGLILNANGTGALRLLGGVTAETAGAKTVTLAGTSAASIENQLGPVTDGVGTIAISKPDASTWILNGPNRYSGSTVISDGVLRLRGEHTSGALTFGATNTTATTGTLDVGENATFTGTFTVQTNSANANNLIIAADKTLTLSGNVVIGSSNGSLTTTNLTATGGGALNVANPLLNGSFVVGGNTGTTAGVGNRATADFSGLSSVTINLDPASGTVRVNPTNSQNVNDRFSTLLLPTTGAGTTSITANQFNIGDSAQLANGQRNAVVLGSGTTTLHVNTLNIGTGARDLGAITFANASGNVVLRAADGTSPATFNMGTGSATTGVSGATGNLFDVTGHNADLLIGAMNIGTQNARTSALNNTFSFDQGTLSIQSLTLSSKSQSTGTAANTTSTMNLGGGTTTIGTGTGAAITMATHTGSLGSSIARLNLTGGEVTVKGDIVRGADVGNGATSATVTLVGGSLNMESHVIGSATAPINFEAQSGRLHNLGQLNGGSGLTKTTGGALYVEGDSDYTGPTNVLEGLLEVRGTLSGTNALNVSAGATLATATANAFGATPALTLSGGTFASNGFSQGSAPDGADPVMGLGVLNLNASSTIDFGAGSGTHLVFGDIGAHTPGSFTLALTNWSGSAELGTAADDRLVFNGLVSDFTSRFAQTDVSFNGEFGYVPYQLTPSTYLINIPEPSSVGLLTLAGAFFSGARWRRRKA